MNAVLADAEALLPLAVAGVAGDADGVLVHGPGWHLRVNTGWVLREGRRSSTVLAESGGDGSAARLGGRVSGRTVTALGLEYHGPYGDLLLALDDGAVLEVVSDFPYGEWILSIRRGQGSGEPPVFDLSGPYAADPYSAQLGQHLRLLASGAIGPQEAADWATATMEEDVDFDDTTWQGLDRLAGADLLVGPDTPLHGPADFAAWLREFEQGIAAS